MVGFADVPGTDHVLSKRCQQVQESANDDSKPSGTILHVTWSDGNHDAQTNVKQHVLMIKSARVKISVNALISPYEHWPFGLCIVQYVYLCVGQDSWQPWRKVTSLNGETLEISWQLSMPNRSPAKNWFSVKWKTMSWQTSSKHMSMIRNVSSWPLSHQWIPLVSFKLGTLDFPLRYATKTKELMQVAPVIQLWQTSKSLWLHTQMKQKLLQRSWSVWITSKTLIQP